MVFTMKFTTIVLMEHRPRQQVSIRDREDLGPISVFSTFHTLPRPLRARIRTSVGQRGTGWI